MGAAAYARYEVLNVVKYAQMLGKSTITFAQHPTHKTLAAHTFMVALFNGSVQQLRDHRVESVLAVLGG